MVACEKKYCDQSDVNGCIITSNHCMYMNTPKHVLWYVSDLRSCFGLSFIDRDLHLPK